MNNRKNYNSIVFLTTLSVYLGLVLVGGSPQVWAQAALTRPFDIQTEFESEDDLDKNPDEQALEIYSAALRSLVSLANDFSAKNAQRLGLQAYEFDCAVLSRANCSYFVKSQDGTGSLWGGFVPPLKEIARSFPQTVDKTVDQTGIKLVLSGTDVLLSSSLTPEPDWKARQTACFYENFQTQAKIEQAGGPPRVIFDHTDVSAENNQVFIVTRLPRASIEA